MHISNLFFGGAVRVHVFRFCLCCFQMVTSPEEKKIRFHSMIHLILHTINKINGNAIWSTLVEGKNVRLLASSPSHYPTNMSMPACLFHYSNSGKYSLPASFSNVGHLFVLYALLLWLSVCYPCVFSFRRLSRVCRANESEMHTMFHG